jgi:hypothetical protein
MQDRTFSKHISKGEPAMSLLLPGTSSALIFALFCCTRHHHQPHRPIHPRDEVFTQARQLHAKDSVRYLNSSLTLRPDQ